MGSQKLEQDKFASFRERAKDVATVGEGLMNIDAAHEGTFADQRRLEQLATTHEEESRQLNRTGGQQRSFAESAERLREAARNNKEWIEARLNILSTEERQSYLAKEQDLVARFEATQKNLDNYKPSDEPELIRNMPVRKKLEIEFNAAKEALRIHEASLIELSQGI